MLILLNWLVLEGSSIADIPIGECSYPENDCLFPEANVLCRHVLTILHVYLGIEDIIYG